MSWRTSLFARSRTNSGKGAGDVWKNLPLGGPEGNQSDYPRDLLWANFQTIPKAFPLLVRLLPLKTEEDVSRSVLSKHCPVSPQESLTVLNQDFDF